MEVVVISEEMYSIGLDLHNLEVYCKFSAVSSHIWYKITVFISSVMAMNIFISDEHMWNRTW